ncbi:MAG: hypothetical protein II037_08065, partial [Bacteroidales bacterium]|nr:hypothetical protein [Bacteroidales bacterium]
EYSYDEWSAKYEARREEVEKLVDKMENEYTRSFFTSHHSLGQRHILGDVIDEATEEKLRSQFSEEEIGSEEYEEKLKSAQWKHYIIVLVVLGALILLFTLLTI